MASAARQPSAPASEQRSGAGRCSCWSCQWSGLALRRWASTQPLARVVGAGTGSRRARGDKSTARPLWTLMRFQWKSYLASRFFFVPARPRGGALVDAVEFPTQCWPRCYQGGIHRLILRGPRPQESSPPPEECEDRRWSALHGNYGRRCPRRQVHARQDWGRACRT